MDTTQAPRGLESQLLFHSGGGPASSSLAEEDPAAVSDPEDASLSASDQEALCHVPLYRDALLHLGFLSPEPPRSPVSPPLPRSPTGVPDRADCEPMEVVADEMLAGTESPPARTSPSPLPVTAKPFESPYGASLLAAPGRAVVCVDESLSPVSREARSWIRAPQGLR